MKEVKTFFSQGNGLNKGYAVESESSSHEDENSTARRKMAQNLPAIDLMIAYEEAHPGTFERLMKMTEKEQTHRHNAELVNIQMHARASAMGRLFGFFTVCAICYTTFHLALFQLRMNDTMAGALMFAAVAFMGVLGVSFMAYCRTSGRYNDRRKGHDRHQHASARVHVAAEKGVETKERSDNFKTRYNNGQRRRRR